MTSEFGYKVKPSQFWLSTVIDVIPIRAERTQLTGEKASRIMSHQTQLLSQFLTPDFGDRNFFR